MSSNNIFVYNDVIGNKQINLLKIQKSKKKIQKKIIYNRYLPLELINLIITFIPISNRIDVLLERFSLKNKMKIYFKYTNKIKIYKLYTYANMLKNVFILSKKITLE